MRALPKLLLALTCLTPALGLTTGCGEPKADIANKQHYSGHHLNFDYPGNWKTSEESEGLGGTLTMTMIYVEAKGGNAMVIVQHFNEGLEVDYDELVSEFVNGMREAMPGIVNIQELDGGQRETIEREIDGQKREGRRIRYAPEIFGESVPHTVEAYFMQFEGEMVILYTQVPDEDRSKAEPGFNLILDSLTLGE